MSRTAVRLELEGRVQGVGLRPFAVRTARRLGLAGSAANVGGRVWVELEGEAERIDAFVQALLQELPAPGRVERILRTPLRPWGREGFHVAAGAPQADGAAGLVPDLALCADCRRELSDPRDRRFRYPFASCALCGPRWSILLDLPWERARTTMRAFPLCRECRAEFEDPADRRFRAETIACPACGPRVFLCDADGRHLAEGEEALTRARELLGAGGILALKGLGGYQLLVDAGDARALGRLRARKRRPAKPFALMVEGLEAAERLVVLDDAARRVLASPAAPIVLLPRRADAPVAGEVAPDLPWLGVMLAYTPLHLLLLDGLGPVVATSGNRSGEPIAYDEPEAFRRLAEVADLFLVHDRPIARPLDDSVVRVVGGRELVLRRARGYVPEPVRLPRAIPPALAVGGHLKAAVAVGRDTTAVLGAHIGDLDHPIARDLHAAACRELPALFRITPERVACDLHPAYASRTPAEEAGVPVVEVQHHLAHVLSCLAEHGCDEPVLGVAFDGTGDGGDGTVWGGELLWVDPTTRRWRRAGHLRSFRLPGGEAAVREPRRAAFGLLHALLGAGAAGREDLPPVATFTPRERALLVRMLERGTHAPRTTSCGRLFDAVAALSGLVQVNRHEAEAAMRLEGIAAPAPPDHPPFRLAAQNGRLLLDWEPLVRWLLADRPDPPQAAAALHAALAHAVAAAALRLGAGTVALTGGCFQNARLEREARAALEAAGVRVLVHGRVPPGDGGLALGQLLACAGAWEREDVPRGAGADRVGGG